MSNGESQTSPTWPPKQMLIAGLIFFVVSVILRRVWSLVDDEPEPWTSTLIPSAIAAVLWIYSMRWWLNRQSRRDGR
jgi:hypothetical protein